MNEKIETIEECEEDFVRSDYCRYCEGDGIDPYFGGQCEICKSLHSIQARLD